MSTLSASTTALRKALEFPPDLGPDSPPPFVVRLEQLCAACPENGFRIDYSEDRCRISVLQDEATEEIPLRKSVFRAILAGVAARCDAYRPGSTSPYGGDAEFVSPERPGEVFRAVFVNTTAQQSLTLTRSGDANT